MKKRFSSLIIIAFLTMICLSTNYPNNQESSLVAVSATSNGLMQKGYGIVVYLTNLETHQIYKSKSLGPISSHSIIKDLPAGNYMVSKVEVPVGSIIYVNWSEKVRYFFGVIEVQPGRNYYLGNFTGTRKIGSENVLNLRIEDEAIPEELFKRLNKKKFNLTYSDFSKTYPYSQDELLVY